jgi:hypothetical protein
MTRRALITGAAVPVLGLFALGAVAGMFTASLTGQAYGTTGDCGNTPAHPLPTGKFTQTQISELWVRTGGPVDQAGIAGAVGMAESRGDPNVVNSIGAGGLMQIYPPEPGYLNPETNMRIALRKYRESLAARGNGWLPWETYTNGAYRAWLRPTRATPEQPVPCVADIDGSTVTVPWRGGTAWPVALPGFPGESCDPRIIPNVIALTRRYKLTVTDCFSTNPVHASDGEHPLGLAVDLVPAPDGSWDLVDRLAHWAEPTQDHPRPPFRWVGYDGDSNHGRGNHLHLSWSHGPGRPAETVTVLATDGTA